MRLYLVRHGKAKSKDQDPSRSLTGEGIEETTRISQLLSGIDLSVPHIGHSGKARAEQTAQILAKAIRGKVEAREGLAPLDDPQTIVGSLSEQSEDLMLVGHLPHLERLSATLLTGKSDLKIVEFQTSSVVCLRRQESQWTLLWAVTSELVR